MGAVTWSARLLTVAALVLAVGCGAGPDAQGRPPQAVPILMYHHIAAPPGDARNPRLWVRPSRLSAQVRALERAGYRAVTLGRVWRAWHGGPPLPARPVVISFDDGYASQHRHAGRILRARRWPGVLNLTLSNLDTAGGLRRAEVRRLLADGWELGAHSLTHPDLTRVTPAALHDEVAGSRAALQDAFATPVDFYCYPSGRVDATVAAAVRDAGFLGATTTRAGQASPAEDPYRLRRMLVHDGHTPASLLRRLR